jgi:hypothetical protein
MRKALSFFAAMLVAGAAYSQAPNPASGIANAGIAADLGTTALGLAMGAAEANPLGFAVIPLKFLAKSEIDKIPDENQRREASAMFTGVQFGAAAANLCTLAMGNPAVAAVCFAGGMTLGYKQVKAIPTETDCFNRHLPQFQEAAATGRVYRVMLDTCLGRFEDAAPRTASAEVLPAPL